MIALLRKNKFRPSALLIAALLIILTVAVPGSRGTTSPSTGSYAEPIGIGMSDPEVVYDAIAGHWYASIIDTFDVNRVNFAVSATADPTGTWFIYRVIANRGPAGECLINCQHTLPDQPYIGYSDDNFLITANDFVIDFNTGTGPFIGVQVWILNKAEMIAGNRFIDLVTNDASSTLTTPTPVTSGNPNFAIRPAQHLSSTPVAYMAENCETTIALLIVGFCASSTTTTRINRYATTGTPPGSAAA